MQCMHEKILKEVNGDHKYLMCKYLQYNSFEVIYSAIELDKVYLVCTEIVKSKPTGND